MASSLVADYSSSESECEDAADRCETSSSDSSSDSDNQIKEDTESAEPKRKLPPPLFSDSGAVKNSVFANKYVEAEKNKMAVLEKHVKMVPQKTLMSKINGKKVCWMYRKGRCRFGHTCKFAHDSDIINPLGGSSTTPEVESVVLCSNEDSQEQKPTDANESIGVQKPERKRKKKPGLSQTLVPGKKVMKMFKSTNSSSLLAP